MVKNLYDSKQFKYIKQLEKDFDKYLEDKVAQIITRFLYSENEFEIYLSSW